MNISFMHILQWTSVSLHCHNFGQTASPPFSNGIFQGVSHEVMYYLTQSAAPPPPRPGSQYRALLLALAITRYCSMLARRVRCIGIIVSAPCNCKQTASVKVISFLICLFITVAENNCIIELTGNVHCQY